MPAEDFRDIQRQMEKSIDEFMKKVPARQKEMLDEILFNLKKLDLNSDRIIKNTVKNIRLMASIRNKLNRLIVNDDYIKDLKKYIGIFDTVTSMQNDYWKQQEAKFKPKTLLKEIKKQTVEDTVNKLSEAGIGANITDKISDLLRANITTGGSYQKLEQQLRNYLTDNSTG